MGAGQANRAVAGNIPDIIDAGAPIKAPVSDDPLCRCLDVLVENQGPSTAAGATKVADVPPAHFPPPSLLSGGRGGGGEASRRRRSRPMSAHPQQPVQPQGQICFALLTAILRVGGLREGGEGFGDVDVDEGNGLLSHLRRIVIEVQREEYIRPKVAVHFDAAGTEG
jgi:hypothetical protein